MNIHKQYGVYFVCHLQDSNLGPRPRSERKQYDALDRSATDPLSTKRKCVANTVIETIIF